MIFLHNQTNQVLLSTTIISKSALIPTYFSNSNYYSHKNNLSKHKIKMQGVVQKLLIQDFKACIKNLKSGIIVQPYISDVYKWNVTMLPTTGVYRELVIQFDIHFENFPGSVPKIIFLNSVVHPLINPSNKQFDCSDSFTEWNTKMRVYELINYIYDSFVEFNTKSNRRYPDQKACNLYNSNQEEYRSLLVEHAKISELNTDNLHKPREWSPEEEKMALALVGL